MLNERLAAAQSVATKLHDFELALDQALILGSQLLGAMPAARIESRLSCLIGQGAIDRAVDSIGSLSEARRKIVATHEALAEVQVQIGLRAVSFGDLQKPPAQAALQPDAAPLRIVG